MTTMKQAEIERRRALQLLGDALTAHVKALRGIGLGDEEISHIMSEGWKGEYATKGAVRKQLELTGTVTSDALIETLSTSFGSSLFSLRYRIRDLRSWVKPPKMPTIETITDTYPSLAMRAVSKVFPKMTAKTTPSIRCRPTRSASVAGSDDGGSVWLSPNWGRSVHEQGIAVCEWLSDHVLVVKAKRKPSAFLADMGVQCYEVVGLRLGQKAYRVEGYAFQAKLGDDDVEDFRRGVAQMEKRIVEATEKVFASA
jgi:hypothetical protein